MKINIQKLLEESNKKNILVIGDFMIDEYLIGKVERINPEAPVPILNVKKETFSIGGAGNVVRNVLSLNANVYVSTILGDDSDVEIMKSLIKSYKIPTNGIFSETNRRTTRKTRLLANFQHLIRYDRETKHDITKESEQKITNYITSIIDKIDIVILEDYGKGVLTENLLKKTIKLCNEKNKPVLIDPNKSNWLPYSNATIITPNKKEASESVGYPLDTEESIARAGFELMNRYNLPFLLITRSEEGMSLFIRDENKKINIPTRPLEIHDGAGAGDTVIASLGVALSCGLSFEEASLISNIAGGIVVSKSGIATASMTEIINELEKEDNIYLKDKKLKTLEQIKIISQDLKNDNKKIVFTNGCFDIIHSGHIKYLELAANLGDVLIVAINSDNSVKRIKGNNRPINTVDDRVEVLSALAFIDYIIIFDEDTPYKLIEKIKPDILVKGGDYKPENIVGADIVKQYNGEVIALPFLKGKSSTKIIEKASLEP